MTDDLTPFEPHQLDEVLSAALDGELDAAATDMGLSLDDVSARLRVTPGAEARRAELSAARDLLAEPVDIDELVAARLRASAVRAHAETAATPLTASPAAASRRTQWLWRSAGIAAAIAGLGAVVFALGGSHSSSKSASSAPEKSVVIGNSTARTPGTTTKPSAPTIQALGSFTSLHDLARAAVAREVFAAPGALTPSALNGNADQGVLPSTSAADSSGSATTQFQTAKDARRATSKPTTTRTDCPVPADVPIRATPILRGTASLSGKPVIVTVFAGNGEHVVVVQDTNCALVNVQMMG